MSFRASLDKREFTFRFEARTSRGLLRTKTSWFLRIWDEADPSVFGIGECSPVPKLSPDDGPELDNVLRDVVSGVTGANSYSLSGLRRTVHSLVAADHPSVRFAVETAILDLINGGRRVIYENEFVKHKAIPINGLIWMGDTDLMLQQVTARVSEGYRCIKMKVGGINFEKECDILYYIRRKYFRDEITIRLDANGAFKPADALLRLHELSRFDIHSIEQPIKPGLEEMAEVCSRSPIPVALDEELIGVEEESRKIALLKKLRPAHIVLKPTLHGGMLGCADWIHAAQQAGVGFWITSALESNVGLNALCQFAANYPISMPQGLGTGMLYEDNIPSPLTVHKGTIMLKRGIEWEL